MSMKKKQQRCANDFPYNKCVAYVRVSTRGQDYVKQKERIYKFLSQRKDMVIRDMHEETCCGETPCSERPALRRAIVQAVETESCLLVVSPDRLARCPNVMKEILEIARVPIVSVRHGRELTKQELIEGATKGGRDLVNIRNGTKAGLSKNKEARSGRKSREGQKKGGLASATARRKAATDKIDEIAALIVSEPRIGLLSNRELAEELNGRGILTTWKRKWTVNSIKKKRKAIDARVEEMLLANPWQLRNSPEMLRLWSRVRVSSMETVEEEFPTEQEQSVESEMKELEKLDKFGMF